MKKLFGNLELLYGSRVDGKNEMTAEQVYAQFLKSFNTSLVKIGVKE